jgi:hypothetical protein
VWRVAALAAGPAWRRTPSLPIIVAGAATGALLWWRAAASGDELLVVIRAVTVAIAAASAMVVDDPSEAMSDVTPFGRPRRRLLAVGLTGLVATVTWIAAVGIAARLAPAGEVPVGFLFVEFAGLCVLGWSLGYGSLAALGPDGAGARATFAVPLAVTCSFAWPWTHEQLWEPSHHTRNWIVLVVVGAAVSGSLSRDTATRRLSV